ncbi:MAG: rhodanese-like domain-containing protein [Steroidobacteraceae bacterium]
MREAASSLTGRRQVSNNVTAIAAAPSADALAHFEQLFKLETDCWDVHDALSSGQPGFVLLDVRGPEHFRKGHVAGALSLPHGKIIASKMTAWPPQTLFVVYCAGPHCNGAARAAVRLSTQGRPVKIMIGGITGWRDEGFPLVEGAEDA